MLIKFFEFYTSQPIQSNCTAIISSLQQSTQSWCQFHPVPAKQYKVSVFKLVSLKTTHSSTWCQICCKTWIWATHQGRCQLQGVHPVRVDEPRKPHSQGQMMPKQMTNRVSLPTTLPRWESSKPQLRQVQHSLLHQALNPVIKWHRCF